MKRPLPFLLRFPSSVLITLLLGLGFVVDGTVFAAAPEAPASSTPSATYPRLLKILEAVPAVDTHDHPMPFELLPGRVNTERGTGMTLQSLWQNSYYSWMNPLTAWPKSGKFDEWWAKAKHDFDNARATSFYRYQLPAFTDLYGVDFDQITDDQARTLNDQIFEHYRTQDWFNDVILRRANIEVMLIDPFWSRFSFTNAYPFAVQMLNVTTLISTTQPQGFPPNEPLPQFAAAEGLRLESLDDYVQVIDRLMARGKAAGVAGLKTTTAYQRTLDFAKVPKERAEAGFGKPRNTLPPAVLKDFEDYIFWRLVELSAKHDLPFQIHTGHARIQGSNPMLLVDCIAANPQTKFVLFHGGYPWIGETGAIATRHANVWIDSVWLPTISYTMAKRAYQEWLEVVPSNRILWGADAHHAEGIYAATQVTRRCLAEALAEKVDRHELREEHAVHIGRQILRENALALFPALRAHLDRR